MDKQTQYDIILNDFKNVRYSDTGTLNPHDLCPDFSIANKINMWEIWQGDLDADIMLIGQDSTNCSRINFLFNSDGTFKQGTDDQTDKRLQELFSILGIDIGLPSKPNKDKVKLFFTNASWGIKSGTKDSKVSNSSIRETSTLLRNLIDVIQPKYLICMGRESYNSFARNIYPKFLKYSYSECINLNGEITLPNGTKFLVVWHCGPKGKITRPENIQNEDWKSVKKFLEL